MELLECQFRLHPNKTTSPDFAGPINNLKIKEIAGKPAR